MQLHILPQKPTQIHLTWASNGISRKNLLGQWFRPLEIQCYTLLVYLQRLCDGWKNQTMSRPPGRCLKKVEEKLNPHVSNNTIESSFCFLVGRMPRPFPKITFKSLIISNTSAPLWRTGFERGSASPLKFLPFFS
jgi:hypothetical protein